VTIARFLQYLVDCFMTPFFYLVNVLSHFSVCGYLRLRTLHMQQYSVDCFIFSDTVNKQLNCSHCRHSRAQMYFHGRWYFKFLQHCGSVGQMHRHMGQFFLRGLSHLCTKKFFDCAQKTAMLTCKITLPDSPHPVIV